MENGVLIAAVCACVFLLLLILQSRRKIAKLNQALSEYDKQNESYKEINQLIFMAIRHDVHSAKNALNSFQKLVECNGIPSAEVGIYSDDLKRVILDNAFLLENLFYWGSVQAIDFKPSIERFDIGFRANEVLASFSQRYAAKNLTISNHIAENMLISADMNLIELVLKNIIYNAIKYTHPGGTIDLFSEREKDQVRILIKDNGIGMSPERVQQFNNSSYLSFVKSNQGTNGEQGTGIGLILCKYLLKLMNANVSLSSEEGKGSTFSILFPLQDI